MQSDASVKAAYDTLKAVETESHTLSTTVTVTTYDEAVASIEKAKTIEQKAAEVTASVAPLQEAITTYQEAKAGSASNASTTPKTSAPEQGGNNSNAPAPSYSYNGNGGSSNSGSNGSSYSGGLPTPLRHLRPTTLARVMVASTSAPDRLIDPAVSSSKVVASADRPIARSPVAWFVTRYGASSSQRPNTKSTKKRSTNAPMEPTAMANSNSRCYTNSHKSHHNHFQKDRHRAPKWRTRK